MSYGVNPHYEKLPIFSEFMENSTKFMKNSDLTKWTQNLRWEDQTQFQGPGVPSSPPYRKIAENVYHEMPKMGPIIPVFTRTGS